MEGIAQIVREVDFTIIAAVVDKRQLGYSYVLASDVYKRALSVCLGRLQGFLKDHREDERTTHIIVESRGIGADRELVEGLGRIRDRGNSLHKALPSLKIRFADKKTNSAGLQIADLTARPIGRHFIDREQPNRAWDAIEPKLLRSPHGEVDGWGMTILPQQRKAPE